MLKFYNTLTRKLETFRTIKDGEVRMYNCGPTVYGPPHIGNFRSFMFADMLRRYLEFRGYEVFQVTNITDIDDKTIRDSKKEGLSLKDFTEKYTHVFLQGIDSLNIQRAKLYPRATEEVDGMIELIEKLLKKGLAYVKDDGIYYDISKFKNYGKLGKVNLSAAKRTERVLSDEYEKENINDFALWKMSTEDEIKRKIFFNSPWGKGRPGWHIECSVMSMKYLGQTIDIHTGGIDLVFPHHENEIAQSEGATGKKFVNYWMHCEHLKVDGKKMSKSLGNFITLDDILKKYGADTIRYFFLSTHYRKQLNYTEKGMDNAKLAVDKLKNTLDNMDDVLRSGEEYIDLKERDEKFISKIRLLESKFEKSMDNDLDSPGGIKIIHELSKTINDYLTGKVNKALLVEAEAIYRELLFVFGLLECQEAVGGSGSGDDKLSEKLINLIVDLREELRKNKMYDLSDKIRSDLEKAEVILEDKAGRTGWKIKK
jgi:cysteinyl-tRNA synthetase